MGDSAVVTSTVDLFGKDAVKTPAKLEMDKGGKFKLEASSDKVYPKLKVECKSDLADLKKVTVGCTYSGIKDTLAKFETKLTKPDDFVCDVTHSIGMATCGLKFGMANITN